MSLRFYTYAERPELERRKRPLLAAWPQFMLWDPVADACFGLLYDRFPGFQHFLVDEDRDELIAEVNSVPAPLDIASLPDRGWDETMERGTAAYEDATVVSAIQVMIHPARQGEGLAALCLGRMREAAGAHGFRDLVAPVRPSWKGRYPLTPMEAYAAWTTEAGLPFDPWLRVHARLGASIVRVCAESMTIPGTLHQWREWTGLTFPRTARYVIPGALAPVSIDVEAQRGVYVEPNVWMHHRI
jgi:GNAT superfamily N-acetyltransferase